MQTIIIINIVLLWILLLFNMYLTIQIIKRFQNTTPNFNFPVPPLSMLEAGSNVPDFKLKSLEGDFITREYLTNHETFMVFISPGCEPCRSKLLDLKETASKIEKADAKMIIVSLGSEQDTMLLLEEAQLELTIFTPSEDTNFTEDYKVNGVPSYYIIDEKGRVKAGSLLDHTWDFYINAL